MTELRPLCRLAGCDRIARKVGLCSTHYDDQRQGVLNEEAPRVIRERMPRTGPCRTNGCSAPIRSRGLCAGHYNKLRRTRRCACGNERRASATLCDACHRERNAAARVDEKWCGGCKATRPAAAFGYRMLHGVPRLRSRCRSCESAEAKKRRVSDPGRARDLKRQSEARFNADPARKLTRSIRTSARKLGLDVEEVMARFAATEGRCECCGLPCRQNDRLSIDHCHATGRFRGLLCSACNTMMGHAQDDPARLRAGADYLEASDRKRLFKAS